MSEASKRIAAWVLAVLLAVFVWWGWKQGAYFGSVFYPGAILAFLLVAVLLAIAPLHLRLKGPALIALGALAALSVWTLLSGLWSPAPAMAIRYGLHDVLYVVVFVLALWATHLLGPRMRGALIPVGVGVTLVGVATAVTLAFGDNVTWYLHEDATLRFPIGYRNANATFFLIGLWPVLALAVSDWRWQLRALLVASGTLLVELAFLCQSRGTVPAAALAGVVYLAVSRDRLRAAVAIALVAVPAAFAVPTLLEVYRHGEADAAVVPLLHDAAQAIGITTVLSLALASLAFGALAPRIRLSAEASTRIFRVGAVVALVAVLGATAVFVSRHGGPTGFVDQRVKEFKRIGYPDLHGQGIRYGANIGSNRHDFWSVAAHEGLDRPLLGSGAGGFEAAYMERRASEESPEDPHSVEALMFSELGLPGLLLFLTFIVASVFAVLRSRRLGPGAAGLAAAALGGVTQWLLQASYDWLWNYPGVTVLAIFLLGAAAAPAVFDPKAGPGFAVRRLGVALAVIVALVSLPLWFSARFFQQSYGDIQDNPAQAIADLDRAADLNPLDADPLLVRASIESGRGETAVAVADLRSALDREPRNFEATYLLARELGRSDPAAARAVVIRARELNPLDPGARRLERELSAPANADSP